MMNDFDRSWFEYLQRLLTDREAQREFAEKAIEQARRDGSWGNDDGES